MKRNIFIFWIGERETITPLLDKFNSRDFEVHVGPSKADHDHLCKISKYYKVAYQNKIWAFCSDVWRAYKLSNNTGMYVDTSTIIGKDIKFFFDRHINFETTLFKETSSSISSSVMFSGVRKNTFFAQVLEIFKADFDFDIRLFPIISDVISALVAKMGTFYGFDDFEIGTLRVLSLMNIRNVNEIKKIGSQSWRSGTNPASYNSLTDNNFWKLTEEMWLKKKGCQMWKRRVHKYINSSLPKIYPLPQSIREVYDNSTNKAERKALATSYKKINFHVHFLDKLFFSKLFVFFKTFNLKSTRR